MVIGPRISVNKLGEYLTTSSAVRRRRIIREQRTPPPVVVRRYWQAAEPIYNFLASGGLDLTPMADAIDALRQTDLSASDWIKDDNANTADALEYFLDIADTLPLDGIEYVKGDPEPPRLEISGVSVSIRPDFLLYFSKRGRHYVGSLKIHYIRGEDRALRTNGQEYVATLCRQWLLRHGPTDREVLHTHCLSLEVFRRSLVHAPASYMRRMREIETACDDISLLWPSLMEAV